MSILRFHRANTFLLHTTSNFSLIIIFYSNSISIIPRLGEAARHNSSIQLSSFIIFEGSIFIPWEGNWQVSLLGMSLLYLPDTVYETIFQFCGVFVTTNKLGQCCKYLYNAVKTYAKLSLELSFSPQELQRICDYQVEAIYGLPRERISIQWVLQFIHAPRVYVIGGSEDSRRCDVLDMSCGTWRQCGSLSVKRERAFSAVQHSGQIYAISGSVDHAMVSVEKMNVFKNCWTPVAPLPSAVQCSAVDSYRNRLGHRWRLQNIIQQDRYNICIERRRKCMGSRFFTLFIGGRSEHAACLYGENIRSWRIFK